MGRQAQLEFELMAIARLYIMADKLIVPGLKILCASQFKRLVSTVISMSGWTFCLDNRPCLSSLVDIIYNRLPSGDLELKEQTCRLVAAKWEEDGLWKTMQPVVKENSEFTWGFLDYLNVQKTTTRGAPRKALSKTSVSATETTYDDSVASAWKLRQTKLLKSKD
jgi:hypothetical protein